MWHAHCPWIHNIVQKERKIKIKRGKAVQDMIALVESVCEEVEERKDKTR